MKRHLSVVLLAAILGLGGAVVPSGAAQAAVVDPGPFSTVAQRFLQQRADRLVASPRLGPPTPLPMTSAFARRVAADDAVLDSRRESLRRLGVVYTDARIAVTASRLQIEDSAAELVVREQAWLGYPAGTGAPALEYVSEHTFSFAYQLGAWALAAERLSGPSAGGVPQDTQVVSLTAAADAAVVDGDPLNPDDSEASCGVENGCLLDDNVDVGVKYPPSTASADGAPAPGSVELSNARLTGALNTDLMSGTPTEGNIPAGLNYQKMRDYALTHALNYNPDFRSFGNDCTNFLSQILRTGGWKHDTGWYRSNSNWWYNRFNQSYTWAGAENWSRFAPKRTERLGSVWDMWVSDALQLDFDRDDHMDHSMFVTGASPNDLLLSYHTNDTKNRSLKSIISASPNAWYFPYRT